ncbi:YraN family protein [Campylobacter sp. RM12642]|uniref:YraN family protein n=1 Tax=Campylobacter sp. RM12642 TaxID=2735736 RepID=UPI0030149422|nr:YraN family protein [Campylobacter sp. RM12642]
MKQENLLNKSIKGLKSYIFGYENEQKAKKYLEKNNFKIIKTNYKTKFGEIDIIALKDKTLHFIEVKSSKNYESEYYLTPKKLERIIKSIYIFNQHYEDYNNLNYCIDLIAINDNNINYVENIT